MRGLVALIMFAGLVPSAFAHGLVIEARYRYEKLVIRVCFDDGTPVWSASVQISGDNGMTKSTMGNGVASFPMPTKKQVVVTVDAGNGHVQRTALSIPPGPWHENQLFTESIDDRTSPRKRLIQMTIGLGIIAIVTLFLMKVLSRRQAS